MKTKVEIEWDKPKTKGWLCTDNIQIALSAYCQNTKFSVKEFNELSGSEAIYGFCGWLTGRKEVTKMGHKHDCAIIADLIDEFCKANNLSNPIDHWEKDLSHPP